MRRFLRNNGLSIAMFGLFLMFLFAESLCGHRAFNEDRKQHHRPAVTYSAFLTSGTFLESAAENWESEFLEMAGYLVLTSFLFQKGSAESKRFPESDREPRDSRSGANNGKAPWPVRRGGVALRLYAYSLTIAFVLLFLTAFLLHAIGGMRAYNETQLWHGEQTITLLEFVCSTQFWFQSFQNWQSEFLGLGSMVVLSIWLRHHGSPESKPVDAPHEQTGK
jgi:hypothetical protein